jgi:hypothetical protein
MYLGVVQVTDRRIRHGGGSWSTCRGQEYGLAERAAEFVHGRLQERSEGDSRLAHWRDVMEIVQRVRRRKVERRHLMR